jgi:hypothetical protein
MVVRNARLFEKSVCCSGQLATFRSPCLIGLYCLGRGSIGCATLLLPLANVILPHYYCLQSRSASV